MRKGSVAITVQDVEGGPIASLGNDVGLAVPIDVFNHKVHVIAALAARLKAGNSTNSSPPRMTRIINCFSFTAPES